MKKDHIVLPSLGLLFSVLCCLILRWLDRGWLLSIGCGLMLGHVMLAAFVAAYMAIAWHNWLPIPCQWWAYRWWKEQVQRELRSRAKTKSNVLIDYPLDLFLTFSLDRKFEEGGYAHAQQVLVTWLNEFPQRFMDSVKVTMRRRLGSHDAEGSRTNNPTNGGNHDRNCREDASEARQDGNAAGSHQEEGQR